MIGVDFDNTIICYDEVFHAAAVRRKLVPRSIPPTKLAVRDYLRSIGHEALWTDLQGYVYGSRLMEAPAFPGAAAFFESCWKRGLRTCVISHKTKYPVRGEKYDLHAAAMNWLSHKGFLDHPCTGLSPENVLFCETIEEKLQSIREWSCDLFIDDLPSILCHQDFPGNVTRILFDPRNVYRGGNKCHRFIHWDEISEKVLGA